MAIPQSFLDELNARTDIVEVVGRYVTLKKGGANLLGLCPFHEEKSPSFTVSPSKQFYHCFGCGAHGNAIHFLMNYAGMGFVDAVKELAHRAGLPMPQQERLSPAQAAERQQQREQKKTLADINAQAARAYKNFLKTAPEAILYLKGRGVSGAIAAQFMLGYAPAGEHALSSVFADYADPLLEEAGLVIYKEETGRRYDRFRERLIFPIRNVRGETIGFGGRILGSGQPKYLNSPETPIFHKGQELYGLYEARAAIRSQGYALVCEGYMDVVALAQWGFANAVATLGTACTEAHVQLLLRHTEHIVFAFDGDTAGRKAAAKALACALPFASDTRSIRFLFLPKEHDPDSYIRERGQNAFAEQVELALPLSQYLLQVASQDCTLATAEGRARMAHQAYPLWALLPESALKIQIRSEIARIAQMERDDLLHLWQSMAADPRHAPRRSQPLRPPSPSSAPAAGEPPSSADNIPPSAWLDDGLEPLDPLETFAPIESLEPPPAPDWPPPGPDAPPASDYHPAAWPSRHDGERRYGDSSRQERDTRFSRRAFEPRPARPPRAPLRQRPLRREEHAASILLAHMPLAERLGERNMTLLCRLPEPDGRLFAWVDDHLQHHGAQPWAEIKPLLQQAALAPIQRLLPHIEDLAAQPMENYRDELDNALKHIMIRQLQYEIEQVTRHYDTDSQAGARLRQLTAHLATLK